MMKTIFATMLLAFSSLAFAQLPPQPPADPTPRKPSGFLANAGANCRGATWVDDHGLMTDQDGIRNITGDSDLTLVCNQPSDEFARSSGNGTPVAAGVTSVTAIFRNLTGGAQNITCTMYAGRAGSPQFVSSKTVSVGPMARQALFWSMTADNGGVPFNRPTNLVCVLPPGMQANENYNRFHKEVGDF